MDMMTVTQAAAYLGVSDDTVRLRIAAGELAGEKVSPRLWLIPRTEVERLAAAGEVKRPVGRPRRTPQS